ncbi:hypothetical protein LAT59_02045 [Candidatus Gracilibacteria bacterium]|nr:hypothetical protein [Candidatus Gracilibacteria bacterium]
MSIHHQLDLFQNAGLVATPQGISPPPNRIGQGVKGKIISILEDKGDVAFYFDDAFVSPIESGKGKCSLSFVIGSSHGDRNFMFHGDFSILMKGDGRRVEFNDFTFSDEFNTKKIESSTFGKNLEIILSQIQIFLFQNAIK